MKRLVELKKLKTQYAPITEEYKHMVENCQAILIEGAKLFREAKIHTFFLVGKEIVESDAYQKYGKRNFDFIMQLAQDIRGDTEIPIGKTRVYEFIEVYEKYRDYDALVSALMERYGNNFSWAKTVKLVRPPQPEEKEVKCKHCKLHCTQEEID